MKYLLQNSGKNSRTWSIHVRNLSEKYEIEDPLISLERDPPEKSQFKEFIQTKICVFYEKSLRDAAKTNSKMTYFNVNLTGLRGRYHPALTGLVTTKQVKNSRIHLKMLIGDYLTYSVKAAQSGGSPICRCCSPQTPENEDILHILTKCENYSDIRKRMLPGYQVLCLQTKTRLDFEAITCDAETLAQFILDPSSFNLEYRVNVSDPILTSIFQLTRDYCNAIHNKRMNSLQSEELEKPK